MPGAEAEVDFGDVWIELAGESTKCFLFTFRLSFSGKAIHRVYATQGQEAFIEGHVAAFDHFGQRLYLIENVYPPPGAGTATAAASAMAG